MEDGITHESFGCENQNCLVSVAIPITWKSQEEEKKKELNTLNRLIFKIGSSNGMADCY